MAIDRNAQIDLIFGDGDIAVTSCRIIVDDDDRVAVCFKHTDKCHEIGADIKDEFNLVDQDVMMVFDNEKSIDVVINALETVKKHLQEMIREP